MNLDSVLVARARNRNPSGGREAPLLGLPVVVAIATMLSVLSGIVSVYLAAEHPHYALVPILALSLFAILMYALTGSDLRFLCLALLTRATLDITAQYELVGGLKFTNLVGLVVLAISLLLLLARGKTEVIAQARSIPFAVMAVCGAIGSAVHLSSHGTAASWFTEIARMVSNLSIFWMVIAFVRSDDDVRTVLGAATWSSLVPVLIGLASLFTGFRTISIIGVPGVQRIQSVFAHANNYGHYLLTIFFIAFVYDAFLEKGTLKSAVRILQVAVFASLILTFSRSAMIGLAVSMPLFMMRRRRMFVVFLAVLLVMVVILTQVFPDFVRYTLETTFQSDNTSVSTLASRRAIWQRGLQILGQSWLIPVGPGSFLDEVGYLAHNDYLKVMFEYGVVGFGAWAVLILVQFYDGARLLYRMRVSVPLRWREGRALSDVTLKGLTLGRAFASLTVAIVIMSAATNIFNAPVLQWYYFTLWGLVVYYHENLAR